MRALRLAFVTATAAIAIPSLALAAHPAHRLAHHAVPVDAGYTVPMDEARVVTFERPVATVFVGNTTVADVDMIDSHHAYLLGKTFGVTNVIGLDIDHNAVLNKQITVANRTAGAVTVMRGDESYNYSCTQIHCETDPRPGDPNAWVKNTTDTRSEHEDSAIKAAAISDPGR